MDASAWLIGRGHTRSRPVLNVTRAANCSTAIVALKIASATSRLMAVSRAAPPCVVINSPNMLRAEESLEVRRAHQHTASEDRGLAHALAAPSFYFPFESASTEYAVAASIMKRPTSDPGSRSLFNEYASHSPAVFS